MTESDSKLHKVTENDRKWQKMMENDRKWQKMTEYVRKWQKMTESDSKWQKVTENDRKWQKMTVNYRKWQLSQRSSPHNNALQPPFSGQAESSGSAELSIKVEHLLWLFTLYNNTQAGAKRAGVGALALTPFLIII